MVATHATAGAAAVRAGRPYACWIGTSVDDEWRGRRGGLSPIRRAAFAAGLPALRHVERSVLAAARQIYATSRASAAAVAAAGRIDPRDVSVLPIPVDVARFVPEPEEEWIARLEAPTITFVGRATDPRKNISLLLAAAPSLRRRVPGLRVRLVGEPPPGPLPPGVEAVGPVASVADELRSASLFVLPSRQEGFGIVVAEALASGVPVISTRSGGPEEILERSRAGRLLDTFDEDELVETAAALLHDVATLVEMRRRGRSYVEREHSPAVFGNLLRRALRDLDDA